MRDGISVSPGVHFGKPCVAGTRVAVQNILELVGEGFSFEQIVGDYYPDLEIEDVRACVQFAIDLIAAEDIRITNAPAA